MKNKLSIFIMLPLIFLIGCGLKVGNIDVGRIASAGKGVLTGNSLSKAEESAIGEQMTAIILGSSQVHKNQKLQKYVNKVGKWVALHADNHKTEKTNWRFIVIDTPDFNAFSMPGGYVVISSGVIDRLSSEAELAAILAHEVVHVEQKHQVQAIEKSKTLGNLGDLAFAAADYQQAKKGVTADALKNRAIAKELFNVTQNLYTKGLSREDEIDADQKGIVLMTRAGYDPYAYISVLQLIQSIDDNNKMLMVATHPKADERITETVKVLSTLKPYENKTKTLNKRYLAQIK